MDGCETLAQRPKSFSIQRCLLPDKEQLNTLDAAVIKESASDIWV